jgi:hypothetical protein
MGHGSLGVSAGRGVVVRCPVVGRPAEVIVRPPEHGARRRKRPVVGLQPGARPGKVAFVQRQPRCAQQQRQRLIQARGHVPRWSVGEASAHHGAPLLILAGSRPHRQERDVGAPAREHGHPRQHRDGPRHAARLAPAPFEDEQGESTIEWRERPHIIRPLRRRQRRRQAPPALRQVRGVVREHEVERARLDECERAVVPRRSGEIAGPRPGGAGASR